MRIKNIICPTCKGGSFRVAISFEDYSRVIADCWTCQTRMSIPVERFNDSPYVSSTWDYIKYSEKDNVTL